MSEKSSFPSKRSSRDLVWVVYFSLGLCLVYSLFYLASYFGLSFFVLHNRGMVEQTVIGSVFSSSVDAAVWGVGFLVVLAWLFYVLGSSLIHKRCRLFSAVGLFGVLSGFVVWVFLAIFGLVGLVFLVLASVFLFGLCLAFSLDFFDLSRIRLFLRVLFGGLLFALSFEVAAFVLYNVPMAINLNPELSSVALHWNLVELGFANLAYPFLPFVYFLFVLLGVVGAVVLVLPWKKIANADSGQNLIRFRERLSNFFVLRSDGELEFFRRRIVVYLAVLVGAVVSCLFVVFTVFPWANPTGMLVSVDAPVYYQWLVHMRSLDANSALGLAFSNDRALFLVLAYVMSFIISPIWVVQFASAFLLVAFGVVCFFVLRSLCRFRGVWVLGVLLVPFSFQALGLIYAGFFSNMLALILVFVYVVLFFRLLDRWSSLGFLALLFVSVGVLFSHPWTWFIFALSLVVFLFLEWRSTGGGLSGRFKNMGVFVGATLGVGLSSDLLRKLVSPVSSTSSVLSTAGSSLGLPNFGYLLSGLEKSVDFTLGGVYANGLLVFLGIVGLLVLLRLKSGLSRFFVSWIFVGCLTIFFASENFIFDRFLFLLPWVVLSSLGLFWSVGFVSRLGVWGRWRFWVLFIVLLFIFLLLLNSGLHFLFNINVF